MLFFLLLRSALPRKLVNKRTRLVRRPAAAVCVRKNHCSVKRKKRARKREIFVALNACQRPNIACILFLDTVLMLCIEILWDTRAYEKHLCKKYNRVLIAKQTSSFDQLAKANLRKETNCISLHWNTPKDIFIFLSNSHKNKNLHYFALLNSYWQ